MPAEAGRTRQTITLTSTGVEGSASGTAEIIVGRASSLDVSVGGLTPLSVYLVKVDGKLVGALNTDETGAADSSWSTAAHGRVLPLPSSVTLSTAHSIEVANEAGAIVLTGTF
jgi:hypothetical protein